MRTRPVKGDKRAAPESPSWQSFRLIQFNFSPFYSDSQIRAPTGLILANSPLKQTEAQPTNRDRRSAASIELPASRHQPSLRDEPSERLPLDEPDEEPAESEQEEPAAGHGRHQLPPTELTAAAAAAGPQRLNSNSLANRLRIIRLFAPEAIRNGTQNATLGKLLAVGRQKLARLTHKASNCFSRRS